jgi:hypothetical protein
MNSLPEKRSDAKRYGSVHYYTGKPCLRGHIAKRRTVNGMCSECYGLTKSEADKKSYLKHREVRLAYYKEYRDEKGGKERNKLWNTTNIERRRELRRKDYYKHRDEILARRRARHLTNPEINNTKCSNYKKANPGVIVAINKRRDLATLQRTPKWLSETELWMIKEVYILSALRTKLTGIRWNVDHIIPLQGVNVSGLHVLNNLRVIPATINSRKTNKHIVE